jgi:hypothetical protein
LRWTICLGWLWHVILLISASWVARITGVSHQYPVTLYFLSHTHSLFCSGYFGDWVSWTLPGLASNHNPPALSLKWLGLEAWAISTRLGLVF